MDANYSLLSEAYSTAFDLPTPAPSKSVRDITSNINLLILGTQFSFIPIGISVFEFLDISLKPGKRLETINSTCGLPGLQCSENFKQQWLKSIEIVTYNYAIIMFIALFLICFIYAIFISIVLPELLKRQSAELLESKKSQIEPADVRKKLENIESLLQKIIPDQLNGAQIVVIGEINEIISKTAPVSNGQKSSVEMLLSSVNDLCTRLLNHDQNILNSDTAK